MNPVPPRLTLVLALPMLLATGMAASNQGGQAPRMLALFDHDTHAKANKKAGLACTDCHGFQSTIDESTGARATVAVLTQSPQATCHQCHYPPGKPRVKAPGSCSTCHPDSVVPVTHGAHWKLDHGFDARMNISQCRDCHRQKYCVDCHENKESLRFQVHDRSWLQVHGIASMADPASCGTCHLQADCVACHSTGDGRWQ